MSKASEWAMRAAALSGAECRSLTIEGVTAMAGDERPFNVHAAVGRRLHEPVACITDKRLGSIVLTPDQAIALARWILDTFGEGK